MSYSFIYCPQNSNAANDNQPAHSAAVDCGGNVVDSKQNDNGEVIDIDPQPLDTRNVTNCSNRLTRGADPKHRSGRIRGNRYVCKT